MALGANLETDLRVLSPGGVITVYAQEDKDPQIPTYRLMAGNVTIQFMLLYGLSRQELDQAVAWTSAAAQVGALTPLPITGPAGPHR